MKRDKKKCYSEFGDSFCQSEPVTRWR
jgi:hypothetical protein